MKNNRTEQEIIGLCICLEAAGDIANHALLELRDVSSIPGETEVYFHSSVHKQLFLIRLLDFVKEGGDTRLTGVKGSCLEVLRSACQSKSFDINGSIDPLKESLEALDKWLHYKTQITLWLPTLDINATIEVSRLAFLKISGNQSKHNLSRLTGVSKEVSRILNEQGYSVELEHIPLALDDFSEHLEENFFIYYGTWLAELINNVRWGIQEYLYPTYLRCCRPKGEGLIGYSYEMPNQIKSELTRQWYWRLMNNVRTGPYLKKFLGAHYLKEQSSLEWHE